MNHSDIFGGKLQEERIIIPLELSLEKYILNIFLSNNNDRIILKLEKVEFDSCYYYEDYDLVDLKQKSNQFKNHKNISQAFKFLKNIFIKNIVEMEKHKLKIIISIQKNNDISFSLRKKIINQKHLNYIIIQQLKNKEKQIIQLNKKIEILIKENNANKKIINNNTNKYNTKYDNIDKYYILLLNIGISLIIIYLFYNLYHMNKELKKIKNKLTKNDNFRNNLYFPLITNYPDIYDKLRVNPEIKSNTETKLTHNSETIIKISNTKLKNEDLKKNILPQKIITRPKIERRRTHDRNKKLNFNIIKTNKEYNFIIDKISKINFYKKTIQIELRYDSDDDEKTFSNFFENAANAGPTLLLIKTKNDLRFGLFMTSNWDEYNIIFINSNHNGYDFPNWKIDSYSFLISLNKLKTYDKVFFGKKDFLIKGNDYTSYFNYLINKFFIPDDNKFIFDKEMTLDKLAKTEFSIYARLSNYYKMPINDIDIIVDKIQVYEIINNE